MALWIPAAMAAAGLLKSEFIDKPQAEAANRRQNAMRAAQQRTAYFTGEKPMGFSDQRADPFGTAMGYGLTGAQMSQQQAALNKQNEYLQARTDLANAQAANLTPADTDTNLNDPFVYTPQPVQSAGQFGMQGPMAPNYTAANPYGF